MKLSKGDDAAPATAPETVPTILTELSDAAVIDVALRNAEGIYTGLPTGELNKPEIYFYDGKRWARDRYDSLFNWYLLERVIPAIQDDIARTVPGLDDKARKEHIAFARRLDANGTRRSLDEMLRRQLVRFGAQFADGSAKASNAAWLLNCENGTIDLRTGELKPHDPSDYITQLAPVSYDPDAKAPEFERMLRRILPDVSVRNYVLEVLGYALNGTMRAQIFPVFYGRGANGKSTLLDAVRKVLGPDYSGIASGRIFDAQGASNRHPTERMIFKGRRLVLANETGAGMKLDETTIKELTSAEPISARAMRQDFIEFDPTHVTIMQTNNAPRIKGSDEGIWRRVREIPFKVTIPEHERNADLGTILESEAPGILNILLEGHARWYNNGQRFNEPDAVTRATAQYRDESSPLEAFVREFFIVDPDLWAPTSLIWDRYNTWADREGMHNRPTQAQLMTELRRMYDLTKTVRKQSGKAVRGWSGIGMRGPGDDGGTHNTPSDPEPTKGAEADATAGERDKSDDTTTLSVNVPAERITDRIYVDLETTGLHPTQDRVRLLIASDGEALHVFDMFEDARAGLDWLEARRDAEFVAHFAQFDLAMLEGNYGYVHDGPVFCTNVASQIKHAGRRPQPAPPPLVGYVKTGKNAGKPKYGAKDKPHSLRSCVYRELGELMDKEQQRSDWSQPELTDDQLEYAKRDVEVLPALAAQLHDAVDHIGTTELDMRNVKVAAHMAVRGVRFDVNAWLKLARPHVEAIERIDGELKRLAGDESFNVNSVPQKRALLEARGLAIPDTQADTLKLYADRDEVCKLLVERADHYKLATTYGEGFLKDVDREGRVRTTYGVYGAATGRFSSSGPNLQNIPRDPEYRACFIPDEGTKFVIADWSQIEVRYIAAISEDKALQAALATGDVYEATAQSILGIEGKPTKAQRQLAKAVVLGFQYGLGVDKFRVYARDTFGVTLTETEARQYRDAFFATYPRLRAWQRETGQPNDPTAYTAPGLTNSFTYQGRVRRDINLYTERLNTPIQAAGADALKLALAELYDRGHDIALHVHDEIVLRARADEAEVVARELTDVMEAAALEAIDPEYRVPVPAEVAVGDSWADKA